MKHGALANALIGRVPFYYGWVILACACTAAVARAGPAVATLSIFVEPMTREFGWSRAAISGAVSVGGILAAVLSPILGTMLDQRGPRILLSVAVLTTSAAIMALSGIESILAFYLLFCLARLNFAGPFDLGIHGAVNNWFVTQRAFAASLVTVAQMCGLILLPLIGYTAMQYDGWRLGWLAIGISVAVVGFLPTWLLMVRRPEDVGLVPDGSVSKTSPAGSNAALRVDAAEEPAFTRAEALRTRAFWMLALFTALVYPVQAGISLHQASHLIERGLGTGTAITAVTVFSGFSALSGLAFGVLARWTGIRMSLVLSGLLLAASAIAMTQVDSHNGALGAAILFGLGLGGLHTLLPVAWADYFGRRNFGAIRGVALTIQVVAQACGPILSGVLRDLTGNYTLSLRCFAAFAITSAAAALLIRAPTSKQQLSRGPAPE